MRCFPTSLIVICALLVGGCQMGNSTKVSERVQLKQGQHVQCYGLVRIDAEGRAEFRNIDTGDVEISPHQIVAPGGSFGLEAQTGRRHFTVYNFTVESTDRAKQEATVLVETTESSHAATTPKAKPSAP